MADLMPCGECGHPGKHLGQFARRCAECRCGLIVVSQDVLDRASERAESDTSPNTKSADTKSDPYWPEGGPK